jgi:hypothetical protein
MPDGPAAPAPAGPASGPVRVYLEQGKRWVFACALDWPGRCRRGRSEELALENLAAYAPRYSEVTRRAGLAFLPCEAGHAAGFTVAERLTSPWGADFGALTEIPASDATPVDAAAADRMAALTGAAWGVFDQVAGSAPAQLRKGPRGGGRDRDKIIDHVLGTDATFARKLGVRHRQPAAGDTTAVAALRADIRAALARPSDGTPPVRGGWPARFAARRTAWHALDHAWEIEDRSGPDG